MKAANLTDVYQKYKGLWVGLKSDQKTVISFGKTVKEVMENSQKKGYQKPILLKVPARIIPLVGVAVHEV